jgi:hypothetical protein
MLKNILNKYSKKELINIIMLLQKYNNSYIYLKYEDKMKLVSDVKIPYDNPYHFNTSKNHRP